MRVSTNRLCGRKLYNIKKTHMKKVKKKTLQLTARVSLLSTKTKSATLFSEKKGRFWSGFIFSAQFGTVTCEPRYLLSQCDCLYILLRSLTGLEVIGVPTLDRGSRGGTNPNLGRKKINHGPSHEATPPQRPPPIPPQWRTLPPLLWAPPTWPHVKTPTWPNVKFVVAGTKKHKHSRTQLPHKEL